MLSMFFLVLVGGSRQLLALWVSIMTAGFIVRERREGPRVCWQMEVTIFSNLNHTSEFPSPLLPAEVRNVFPLTARKRGHWRPSQSAFHVVVDK